MSSLYRLTAFLIHALLNTSLLCSAYEYEAFAFDWQQRLGSLGLQENNATVTGCVEACEWLRQLLPQGDILPSDTQYFKVKDFYWSAQQAAVSPQCFVQPKNAEDVSTVLKVAERAQCPFAVKSGGHAAFTGASNIEGGITIDLQLLNEITVSDDQTLTRVGPGNRWIDVYSDLIPKNLSVVGGRVAEIGVGGLVLGGGISFFSGRFGWALDGVRNYETVVASGEILNVNLESYPDLYWALRGGGNNFGIVTRFDMETFPTTGMWGGQSFHTIDKSEALLDAFHDFSYNSPQDVDASVYLAYIWMEKQPGFAVASQLTYARPVEYPAILKNFTAVDALQHGLRLRNMTDLAIEIQSFNPNGLRESYSTATFRMNREMLQACVEIFQEEMEPIKKAEDVLAAHVLQIIPTDVTARFGRNGGNCLGIEADDGPLVVLDLAIMWSKIEDDEAVLGVAKRIIARTVSKSEELGVAHRYLYQNYASKDQNVFAGYGEKNHQRLKEISKKYDPEQVFQKLQPGYFKLREVEDGQPGNPW